MILNALYKLYERLLTGPEAGIARPGYCAGNAVTALEITQGGQLSGVVPLGTQKGKKTVPIRLEVPDRVKRTRGDAANFLCDNAEYYLGLVKDKAPEKEKLTARRRFKLAREHHEQILAGVEDDGARAVLAFFRNWNPDYNEENDKLRVVSEMLTEGGNVVFRLVGDNCYVHERPAIRRAWEAYKAAGNLEAAVGQCLVTGEYGSIARLHKSISGIAGANTTGASLVSFNFPATESYGKAQGENSPVSESAAFAYGTALNWLIATGRHRLLMGDTTVVFWAERAGPEENLLLDLFADAVDAYQRNEREEGGGVDNVLYSDEGSTSRVKSALERIMRGQNVTEEMAVFDKGVRFYILGLAPNSARISIRFWHVDTFGTLLERVRRHFNDMAMVSREGERPVTVGRLLLETAPAVDRKREKIPPLLVGSLMRAILDGSMYPQSLYAVLLGRIRSDFNDPKSPRVERKITYPRAAYLKAFLRRKARFIGDKELEEALTDMLNPENKETGYLLGRLFSLLEKAQQDANPGLNATIKDRYYASASATPGTVFPVLLRLAQHHIAKTKSEYGGYMDKLIESVMCDLDSFPAHLSLDEQGLFALGYYQQKSALYQKKSE